MVAGTIAFLLLWQFTRSELSHSVLLFTSLVGESPSSRMWSSKVIMGHWFACRLYYCQSGLFSVILVKCSRWISSLVCSYIVYMFTIIMSVRTYKLKAAALSFVAILTSLFADEIAGCFFEGWVPVAQLGSLVFSCSNDALF